MRRLGIKLFPDSHFRQTVRLDGAQWVLEFKFEDRVGMFTMTVSDADGSIIVEGEPLAPGALLSFESVGGPPGLFVLEFNLRDDGYTRAEIRRGDVQLDYLTFTDEA